MSELCLGFLCFFAGLAYEETEGTVADRLAMAFMYAVCTPLMIASDVYDKVRARLKK